jgi:hypothetical protein
VTPHAETPLRTFRPNWTMQSPGIFRMCAHELGLPERHLETKGTTETWPVDAMLV